MVSVEEYIDHLVGENRGPSHLRTIYRASHYNQGRIEEILRAVFAQYRIHDEWTDLLLEHREKWFFYRSKYYLPIQKSLDLDGIEGLFILAEDYLDCSDLHNSELTKGLLTSIINSYIRYLEASSKTMSLGWDTKMVFPVLYYPLKAIKQLAVAGVLGAMVYLGYESITGALLICLFGQHLWTKSVHLRATIKYSHGKTVLANIRYELERNTLEYSITHQKLSSVMPTLLCHSTLYRLLKLADYPKLKPVD